MTAYTIAFFSKSSDFSDFFIDLIKCEFWGFTSFCFSSKLLKRSLCFCSHFIIFFILCLNGEWNTLTAYSCLKIRKMMPPCKVTILF